MNEEIIRAYESVKKGAKKVELESVKAYSVGPELIRIDVKNKK